MWSRWSETLDMKENPDKLQFFAMRGRDRKKFARAGVERAETFRALGTSLARATGRQADVEEQIRLDSALAQLQKVRLLPVSWQKKQRYAASTGVARASWGWLAIRPSVKDVAAVDKAVRQLSEETGCMGDKHLRRLMRGHGLDVRARAVLRQPGEGRVACAQCQEHGAPAPVGVAPCGVQCATVGGAKWDRGHGRTVEALISASPQAARSGLRTGRKWNTLRVKAGAAGFSHDGCRCRASMLGPALAMSTTRSDAR
jgi:hypothetical protein